MPVYTAPHRVLFEDDVVKVYYVVGVSDDGDSFDGLETELKASPRTYTVTDGEYVCEQNGERLWGSMIPARIDTVYTKTAAGEVKAVSAAVDDPATPEDESVRRWYFLWLK